MATSGSIDYTVDRDDIITEALEIMGALEAGDTPSTDDVTSLSRTLNMMVKFLQAKYVNLFAIQKVYVFLQSDQNEYSLSSSSSDNLTTSFTQTALDGAVSSGGTSLTVDSITGISDGDYIGIKVDDGTMHWDTVNGSPSGSTVTLTTGLDDDASDGAVVYAYTTKAERPMKILNQVVRDSSGRDIPITQLARSDYINLPNKTSDGSTINIYYDPQITTGKLYVWPETDDTSDYLVLWVQRTLEDFDASSDNPDFPQEWYLPLAWNLAHYSKVKFGVPVQLASQISKAAKELLEEAGSYDTEDYMLIRPATRRG